MLTIDALAQEIRRVDGNHTLGAGALAEALYPFLSALVEEKPAVKAEQLLSLIEWAHETLYEINPSNYDHDEVCKLNDASVEVILGLAQALGEKHGKTAEWWERYRKDHPLPALVDVPAVESEPVAWALMFEGSIIATTFKPDEAAYMKASNANCEMVPLFPPRPTLVPASVEGEWMPIETAPKDGTQIIVGHEHSAFSAWWSDGANGWVDGSTDLYDEYVTYEVTHWRPLPAPPALSRKPSDAQTVGGSTSEASGGQHE